MRATDSVGLPIQTSFTVTVNAVADAPQVIGPVADYRVSQNAADTLLDLQSIFQDADVATGDVITYSIAGNNNAGLVTPTFEGHTLRLAYAANSIGQAMITVQATDIAGAPAEVTFTVTVDDAPIELPAVPRTLSYAGSELAINSYTTGSQSYPSVASDAQGNYVVVWSGEGAGGVQGIYGRRYTAAGVPLSDQFQIHNQSGYYSTVRMDGSGNFVVAWTDGTTNEIKLRRYDAAGVAQGAATTIPNTSAGWQPSLSVSSNGSFIVGWNFWNSSAEYRLQRYDATGQAVGSVIVANPAESSMNDGRVAMGADGSFVTTWMDWSTGIYARRFSAAGEALGASAGEQ